MIYKDPHRYDDILYEQHHVSYTHPRMSLYKRAAQFASFKALTGFDLSIEETSCKAHIRAENDMAREIFYD